MCIRDRQKAHEAAERARLVDFGVGQRRRQAAGLGRWIEFVYQPVAEAVEDPQQHPECQQHGQRNAQPGRQSADADAGLPFDDSRLDERRPLLSQLLPVAPVGVGFGIGNRYQHLVDDDDVGRAGSIDDSDRQIAAEWVVGQAADVVGDEGGALGGGNGADARLEAE